MVLAGATAATMRQHLPNVPSKHFIARLSDE